MSTANRLALSSRNSPDSGNSAEWHARHSVHATARRTAALVNDLRTPPAPQVPNPERITEILREHGELDPIELTPHDVEEMRVGANALYAVFAAETVAEAALHLNDLLATTAGPLRLTTHDGTTPWHLHLDSHDAAAWGEWFLASSCLALAVLVGEQQHPPGGVCASRSCDNVHIGLGGGAPRRYCSRRCATRERVAQHRRAQQARTEPNTEV